MFSKLNQKKKIFALQRTQCRIIIFIAIQFRYIMVLNIINGIQISPKTQKWCGLFLRVEFNEQYCENILTPV